MFSEIEKEYKKGLPELRFRAYYARLAIPLMVAAYLASKAFNINSWLTAAIMGVLLLMFVIMYLIKDIRSLSKYEKGMKLSKWLANYNQADEKRRLDSLIVSLRKNHLNTKDDIKLALDHFEQRVPAPSHPSILEIILSVSVALMSVTTLAYDEENRAIDFTKFWNILWPTLSVIFIVMVPVVIIAALVKKLIFSHTKIEVILVEDLAYIYVNYDQFGREL